MLVNGVPRDPQGRCRALISSAELSLPSCPCRGIWRTEDLPENQARQQLCGMAGMATASERVEGLNVILPRGRLHEPRAPGRQGSGGREVRVGVESTGVCSCRRSLKNTPKALAPRNPARSRQQEAFCRYTDSRSFQLCNAGQLGSQPRGRVLSRASRASPASFRRGKRCVKALIGS